MSYDIFLTDRQTGECLEAESPHNLRGGTYSVGRTTSLWLNVTYNYSEHFYRVLGDKGIRRLYGMVAKESVPVLDAAICQLKDDVDPDYWKPTEGNARQALIALRQLAEMRPDGVWQGD